MRRTTGCVALLLLAAAACGDGETTDRRGYTKAPLERPALRIQAEQRSEMDRLGTPNQPRAEVLTPTPAGGG